MSTPKAFIFDLDGTLVDALPDIQANANRALESLGYELRLSLKDTQPHVGGGAHKLASNVLGLPMEHEETMALYHAFADIYEQHPADFSKPFPGVMDVLNTLRERAVPMCCVTAKPAKARVQVLNALGITPYLTLALSPEDGFPKKPAPDMLFECCRVMGVDPSETVMVGDTLFDVEAGLNAGCHSVAFAEHGYQDVPAAYADRLVVLHHFTDLLRLLDE
ncbi:HAD family hydrolase [Mariprofundus erugo]|uniref:phosphoglycolate phosphatase n=1 Tax=Mariprofundus erugo TaxID=2528639 RepID=A0A5R9GV40_9PROT|nr:HAD-IA family hydrolase [Mariprofundus erugo]TLS67892.1 HAD family hydrolase [Mariprofundus erugo]TLS76653.1 HAD family hydrolase [Mariprofundus erugo]